ncbi:MAG: septum formation initiator family protein [Acidimicrobiia bacterium]|nr:septum formation initiator family protein [Acidimicrobiia bacterium]
MISVRRPAVTLLVAAVAVVLLAIATNVVPFRQVVDQRTEIGEARNHLAALVAENATLTQQVAALETPIEVERIAREKLGYVRPGETAYVVIAPEVEAEVVPAPVELAAEEPSFLAKLWAYVTGADLVSE